MPRLFVAIELPPALIARLAQLQPPAVTGVKLVAPPHLHLTLHFLGEADVQSVMQVLQQVRAAAFMLQLEGLGRFRAAGGGSTLWAGVVASRELLELHAAIGACLVQTGFEPEKRRYKPHITLGRCKPEADAELIRRFLLNGAELRITQMQVDSFSLYSSTLSPGGPQYRCEHRYQLAAPADR